MKTEATANWANESLRRWIRRQRLAKEGLMDGSKPELRWRHRFPDRELT